MEYSAVIVIVVVLLSVLTLALSRVAADAVLVAALTILLIVPVPSNSGWRVGIFSINDAISGFSNPGLFTVGVLFVVVTGLRETGAIDWIGAHLLGRPRTLRASYVRVIVPVMAMSSFLNNTPVVAMMIPAITDWTKRLGIAPSKLLIPLSYASILGGTCTLIGTSTNLVVNGLLMSETDIGSLGMFEITWIGFPTAIVGSVFLVIFGPLLLPDRGSVKKILGNPREYTLELLIPEGSSLIGQSVEAAGLRNLPGCYLVDIERNGDFIGNVGPEQILNSGDRLLFAGIVESIRDLQRVRGLLPATDQIFKMDSPRYRRRLFEAVVSETNPIIHKTIKEGRFRNRYQGVIIAVARGGKRLTGRIGDIVLHPGDTLLIESDAGFAERYRDTRGFLLISSLEDSAPRRHGRAAIALVILISMVLVAAMGWMEMLVAAMVASGFMILTRCCTISDARRSVDWSVLVVIGAALGLGMAMDKSGAAASIANALLSVAADRPWLMLCTIYFVTSALTEVITNNGAVALIFPIAYAAAEQLGVDFKPFVFALMMAGSASFATPLGYQTNLMVYGPGGYRFTDFLRIGLPMNLLMGATAVILIPLIWPF